MEELRVIVQRMIENGEPEEKIKEAVRIYKERQKSGNQTGSSVDATAKPKTSASNQNDTDSQSETGFSESPEPARQDKTLVNFGIPTPIHNGTPSLVPELTAEEFEDFVNNLPPTPELEKRVNNYPRIKRINDLTGGPSSPWSLYPSNYPTVNTGDTEVTALNALKGLLTETDPKKTPVEKRLNLDEMETLIADFSSTFNSMFEGLLSSEIDELKNLQQYPDKYKDKIKNIENQAYNELAKKYPGLSKREFQNLARVGNQGLFQQALDNQVSKYNKIKSKANREGGAALSDEEFDATMQELDSRLSPKMKAKKDIETKIREKNRELNSTTDPARAQAIRGEIAMLKEDKKKLSVVIEAQGNVVGAPVIGGGILGSTDVVDEVLASSYMEYEQTKYQAGKIKEAEKKAKATVPVMLEGFMNTNKTMTGFEAFESLLKGKISEKNRLKTYGDTETISLQGVRNKMPQLYHQLKTAGLVNDKSGNQFEVPLSDLYDLGYDVRDFENWFDSQHDKILDKEGFDKLSNYEDAMYRVEGEIRTIHDQAYVNIDPATLDRGGGLVTFAQTAGEAMLTTFTDARIEEAVDIVAGPSKDRTASYMLNKFEEIVPVFNEENKDKIEAGEIDELGFTKAEMKAIEKTFGEEIGEGVGHFVPMLVELGVLSAATGTVMSIPTIARGLATLRGGSGFQKATYHAIMAMIEEGKMYTVGMGATTGSAFYAGGQLTSGATPFKNRFKWMNPLWQKVIKSGPVGAASSQLAIVSEAAYNDLMGDSDFAAAMEDHFGDLEFKDIITESIVFSIVGASHLRKPDLMSTRRKFDAVAELTKSMEDLMPLEGREKMSEKDRAKYDAYYEAKTKLEQQIMVETSALELDVNNKDFEKNFNAKYTKPMEAAIKSIIPEYKGAEVKFVDGRKQMVEEGNAAEFREGGGTDGRDLIIMDKNSYTPGKTVHEFTHMAMEKYFQKNPGMEAKFTKKMETLFKDFNFEAFEGTTLGDFIKEGYKIDGRTTEGKSKAAREYLAYMTELLSDPKIYNQKVATSFFKEAKQEVLSIMEENFGYRPKIRNAREFVELLGRFSQDARRGLDFKMKAGRLADLEEFDFLGIKFVENKKKREQRAYASRDLKAEKAKLIERNKKLVQEKPEGYREKTQENAAKIKELNKNIEISDRNQKNIKRYKEGEAGEPLREAAANQLLQDNAPIIETWFKKNFKRGLDVSESDFRSSMMEGVVKIFNSYNNYDVPFGYYLKSRLEPQLGNTLRRAQAGRTTDIAMSEMAMTAEELQIADTSPELSRSASGPEAPKGRELAKDLNIPEDVISKAEERLADLDVTKLTYKTLKDLVPEYTNEILGVEPKPGNLGKKSVANAQQWFSKDSNARLFIDALPEGTIPMEGAPELVKGTSTGVQNTLLKEFYTAGGRAKTKAGVTVQNKIKNITPRQVKDYFGIKPDGTFVELKNDRSLSQKVKAAVDQIGKAWTNQVVRESLKNNPEYNISTSLQNRLNQIEAGKSKALASKDLVSAGITKEIKKIKWETDPNAASKFRVAIEGNETYVKFLEETGGVKEFFKEIAVNVPSFQEANFKEYAKSQRQLNIKPRTKPYEPKLFKSGYSGKEGVNSEIIKILESQGVDKSLLNIEKTFAERTRDAEFTKQWQESFIPDFYNNFDSRLLGIQQKLFRTTSGEGQYRFGHNPTVKRVNSKGVEVTEKQIYTAAEGKKILSDIKGTKEKLSFDPKYVKAVDNGKFKKDLNNPKKNLLPESMPKTSKEVAAVADGIKKYLSPDGTVKGYEKMTEANQAMLEYTAGKMFDYVNKFKTAGEKAKAINNISYLLQMQTNLGNGIFRGLATHNAVTLKRGIKTHSEHDLQLANFTGNMLIDMLTSSSKAEFMKGYKPMLEAYRQSVIEKSIQEKYDKPEFGGNSGFDFKFTTDAGKYPWMREQIVAETTLDLKSGKTYDKLMSDVGTGGKAIEAIKKRAYIAKQKQLEKIGLASKDLSPTEQDLLIKHISDAFRQGRLKKKPKKGGSVFDFDETLIIDGENFVVAKKGKDKIKISSGNWPIEGPKYAEQGYIFDFSDFVNVRGGKDGPLLQKMKNQIKKYGPDNMFVLTARMQEAAGPIHQWLKTKGIDIPLENITGLGKSQGEAKAMWMLEKVAEGYNDLYFVDDALPNVEAVRKVLDQVDIKSKVQQALASKDLNADVNDIMKHSLGIDAKTVVSKPEAKTLGANIKRRRIFMTDGAADLELLIEPLYGKGKKGTENKKWFEDNFIRVWERSYNEYNSARHRVTNDYQALRKQNKDIVKTMGDKVGDTNLTVDTAMRTYIWSKSGFKIPDLPVEIQKKLVDYVNKNPKVRDFADKVAALTGLEKGLKEPSSEWWAESIASEIGDLGGKAGRSKYLADWIEVKNEIFSEDNLNKMESKLGSKWRNNMEDMLDRMETGRTRKLNLGEEGNAIMDYLNGSVGTIMNFNTRSAVLQTISNINFINHSFNNPLAATKAFANQKQYWKDFMTIMNSDMLKNRRAGLEINVTEAELAEAARNSKNPARAAIAKILKAGFLPTKVMDSFAIASGGAPYYRNAINKYIKEGMSKAEAEKKAFIDFQAIAERTQQSSRPDLLSNQQTSFAGRLILPFANTPMQMNRIMMKELLDLKNGRYKGSFGDNSFTNKMSKVAYYGGIQSMIFAMLQSGALALMTNSDDKELTSEKKLNAVNTIADSFLRGMGVEGAYVAGIKNAILEFKNQNEKGFGADFSEVGEELLNISPVVGSKFTKFDAAGNTYKYNKKQILQEGLTLDGPLLEMTTQYIEPILNIPANRVHKKISNISEALNDKNEAWQRAMVGLGWSQWDVGIGQRKLKEKKAEKERLKEEEKKFKKEQEKEQKKLDKENEKKDKEAQGIKEVRCSGIKSNGQRCNIKIETKEKTALCGYHKSYKPNEGSDRDGDGIKEYQCKATTSSGRRCRNRTERENKKCYAHQ